MTDQVKQTVITLQDIRDNLYTFAKDVVTEYMTGVSQSRATRKEGPEGGTTSETRFKARYHYQGANLQQVMGHAEYQLGVNLRASLRGTGKKPAWIPPAGTKVDVFVTDQGKVRIKNLPTEVQAQILFSGIDDPETRKKAIRAFLSAL